MHRQIIRQGAGAEVLALALKCWRWRSSTGAGAEVLALALKYWR
jgi:hypothetical protein